MVHGRLPIAVMAAAEAGGSVLGEDVTPVSGGNDTGPAIGLPKRSTAVLGQSSGDPPRAALLHALLAL